MASLSLMKRRAQGLKYEGELFQSLDLSSMLAYGSRWTDCSFYSCDLSMAVLSRSVFEHVSFVDCDLPMSRFDGVEMRDVTFEDCRAKHADFSAATPLENVKFLDCLLHYSSFANATVRDIRFIDSNCHGADLRFIDGGKTAVFQGTVLWNASVQLGCQFFSGTFDERSSDLFLAMLARRHANEDKRTLLTQMAGQQAGVVDRLMNDPQEV